MECDFDKSGYESVLTDVVYYGCNVKMNQVVYSYLVVSTIGGIEHHLVKQFWVTKYGNAEWNAFCEWYYGYYVNNETADYLSSKL